MSVCPSICMEKHVSLWMDFHEIWYLSVFQKSVEKILFSFQSDRYNGHFTWPPSLYISAHSHPVLPDMRYISDKSCRVNQNTLLCSLTFFPLNHGIYEIMWKNTVQPDRQQMTIWHMCTACWITKPTLTHSLRTCLCNAYCLSAATVVAQTCLSVTLICPLQVSSIFRVV
jgi:hypothetical protein